MAPPYAREETFWKLDSLIFTVTDVAFIKSKYNAPPYAREEIFSKLDSIIFTVTDVAYTKSKYKAPPLLKYFYLNINKIKWKKNVIFYPIAEEFNEEWIFWN
jgi:hypothetical protein